MEQINEHDFEGYGSEMIDLVKQVKTQTDEIARLKGETASVVQRQSQSEEESYFATLDSRVPGWQSINKDPGFLAWLREPDGLSSRTRQANMTAAHNALDASTVIKYFSSWKGGPRFPPTTQRGSVNTPGGSQWQPTVTVTREQYNAAVQDRVKGRITDEEFSKISNAFQRGIQQGKITAEQIGNTT